MRENRELSLGCAWVRAVGLATLLLWLGVLDVPTAASEDDAARPQPLTSARVTPLIEEALEADDAAALKKLAVQDAPDPWVVSDILCEKGSHAAALAFAQAAPRAATQALPAAIEAQRRRPPTRVRAAVEAFRAAGGRKDWQAAVAAGASLTDEPTSIALVRFEFERARIMVQLRQLREAETLFLNTAERAHELGWFVWERKSLHEAGFAAYDDRRPALTFAHWMRTLAVLERLGEDYTRANTLFNLAELGRRLGRAGEALGLAQQSALLWETEEEPVRAAKSLNLVGDLAARLGRAAEARRAYLRARSLVEGGRDARRLASVLISLADLDKIEGHFDDARRRLVEALAILVRIGDRAKQARALDNFASLEAALGNTHEAMRHADASLAIHESLKKKSGIGHVLMTRAGLHQVLGDLVRAGADYDRALSIAREIGDRRMAAHVLTNIGMVKGLREDPAGAIAAYTQVLPMAEALGDVRLVGHVHLRLCNAYRETKKYAEARTHGTEALEIITSVGDRDGMAQAHNSLGALWLYQEKRQQALPHYERAHELLQESRAGNTYVWTLWGLGECHYGSGRWKEALGLAREAVRIIESMAGRLDVHGGAVARNTWRRIYWLGLRAAVFGKDANQVYWFMETSRAGSLRESLANRAALQEALIPPSLLEAERSARAAVAATAAVLSATRKGGKLRAIRVSKRACTEAQRRLDDVVVRIQREARVGAAVLYPQPDALPAVQARLAPGEALVLYALTEPDADAVALVVQRRSVRVVPLTRSGRLEAAAAELTLDEQGGDRKGPIAELRSLLIEPLGLPPEVKRVLISPAGRLGYVPFAVLLPEHEVVYVPSGTVHGLMHDTQPAEGVGVLAVGDPDYRAVVPTTARTRATARLRSSAGTLAPLPATRKEVNAIGTTKLLGRTATETEVARVVVSRPRWRAIHFACHGLINAAEPQFSSLALTADSANDGFLSTIEIYRTPMPADLVVLSACDTARGRVLQNEGIMGFTQAFMVSGASRVLCSLWKVDDEATRALMVKFYELWNAKDGKGLHPALALRQAQAYVRTLEREVVDAEASRKAGRTVTTRIRRWEDPVFWAAWVLWGLP